MITESQYEKSTLNRYSEWLNSGKKGEFIPQNTSKSNDLGSADDDSDDKSGNEYTTYLPDGSEFSYTYGYSEVLTKEILHYGVVKYHGDQWSGLIVTDNDGKITEIDFVCDEDFSGNEERLQDTLGKQIYQVRMFFEDEVLPGLMN